MNKNFQEMFAKAKQEKRGSLIGFATGMDPNYEITFNGKGTGEELFEIMVG